MAPRLASFLLLLIPSLLAQAPDLFDRTEPVAAGIEYRERRFARNGEAPFTMQILEVDPANPAVNILPVRAHDRAIGKEATSSMAERYAATAAINSGYFEVDGPYAGASAGIYQLDRRVLSAGGKGRTALLLCAEQNYREHVAVDAVSFRGRAVAADRSGNPIRGINQKRSIDDLVLYEPAMGPRTLTGDSGVEVALDAGHRVTGIVDGPGNSPIPAEGSVLSGIGASATWLRAHITVGSVVTTELILYPDSPAAGCRIEDVIGAGPRLISGGKLAVTEEGFDHQNGRHPRTAFAVTGRGTFLLVTLDGRQATSLGMGIDELAGELLSLGAVEAINLDGGGSTAMVVNGRVRNSPSDKEGERAVSDALLVFSIASPEDLRRVIERLGKDPSQIAPDLLARLLDRLQNRDLGGAARLAAQAKAADLSVQAARIVSEALAQWAKP